MRRQAARELQNGVLRCGKIKKEIAARIKSARNDGMVGGGGLVVWRLARTERWVAVAYGAVARNDGTVGGGGLWRGGLQ